MAKQTYSKRQFEEARKRLLENAKLREKPFENDTPEKQRARIDRARTDRMFFLHTYFEHYCTEASPAYHEELFKLGEISRRPVAVTAPRGGAKSVVKSFAEVLHDIVFKKIHFHLFISDTTELAADFCRFVKLELEENDRLRADFGELRGKHQWTEEDFVANGIRVLARGFRKRVRGLRHGPHRPDSVVIDDYENDEEQNNPRILERKERWINEVVIPSLDPRGWKLCYVGTLLSSGSVLARFMDAERNPKWARANFPAIGEDGKSFWPERFPVDELHETQALIGDRAFNQEFMGRVVDEDTAIFRRSWIKREPLTRALIDSCRFRVGYVDASAKAGATNDFKAIITVGWDGARYIILHSRIRHETTTAMMDAIYDNHRNFNISCHGMEEVAFQALFRELILMYGQTKGFALPVQFRKGLPPKEVRIRALQPLFENGQLVVCSDGDLSAGDMERLIEQLVYFPNPSVNDDAPDALEGAIWLAQALGAGMAGIGEVTGGGRRRTSFGFGDEKEAMRNIA